MSESDKDKKKNNIGYYCRPIAVFVLIFAIILLLYVVYRVMPTSAQAPAQAPAPAPRIRGRKIRGGSCGCAAGLGYGKMQL
jgi:hypothetical protein